MADMPTDCLYISYSQHCIPVCSLKIFSVASGRPEDGFKCKKCSGEAAGKNYYFYGPYRLKAWILAVGQQGS